MLLGGETMNRSMVFVKVSEMELESYSNEFNHDIIVAEQNYLIFNSLNNNLIAYVSFKNSSDNKFYIEMIEVIDKGNGWGTMIINEFFNKFNCEKLIGYAMYDDEGDAYSFWERLGAEMSLSFDEFMESYEACYFELNKLL